jgi:hypothetical protein
MNPKLFAIIFTFLVSSSSALFGNRIISNKLSPQQNVNLLKEKIRQEAAGTSNGVTAGLEKRANVMKIVKKLEGMNRVKKLSTSSLLEGKWDLGIFFNSYPN